MGRTIVIAVDASDQSHNTAKWAAHNVAKEGDVVHLCTVTQPFVYPAAGAGPMGASVIGLSSALEEHLKHEQLQAQHILSKVKGELRADPKARGLELHAHALPAAGGASGLAESINSFATDLKADLVVLSSRGMGAVKSTLMSLVGLGSVSGYCLHHCKTAVAIVRGRPVDAAPKGLRKVLVSVDDSELARRALDWAVANLLRPEDELHLVCVALPVPYSVGALAFGARGCGGGQDSCWGAFVRLVVVCGVV